MDSKIGELFRRGAVLFVILGTIGCAAIPRLNITYKLPSMTGEHRQTSVYLSVQDERQTEEIMGFGARNDFGGVPVSIALSVKRGEEAGHGVGVFELPMLLREAFARRIEHAGLDAASDRRPGQAEISIVLKEFFLDLVDRKWRFAMGYEARLLKDGMVLSTQTISGNAERLKLYGHKQADEILAEVFTDTLNQFDPNRLLRRAGL